MTTKQKRKAKHEPTHSCSNCESEEFCNRTVMIGQEYITISRCDAYSPKERHAEYREDEP